MKNYRFLWLMSLFVIGMMAISAPVSASVSKPAVNTQLEELKFTCLVLDWDTISVDAGNALAEALEAVGIDMEIVQLNDDIFYPQVYEGGYYNAPGGNIVSVVRNYQTYEMSSGYTPVPNHVYYRCHSSEDYPWGNNHAWLHNATLDGILETSQNATTTSELKDALDDVQEQVALNVPYIPLFVSDDSHLIRKEWNNYVQSPGGIFTSYNPWSILNMSASTGKGFRMAYPGDVKHLDPLLYVDERSGWVATAIYDTLVVYDDQLKLAPWLASSYVRSADGLQANFTLRSGVKWHDGTDLTPADIKYTIELCQAQKDSPRWSSVKYVENVSIAGQVVIVDFTQPYSWGIDDVGTLKILPKHIWENTNISLMDDTSNATLHIGSGPYKYQSGTTGGPYVLVKNTNYWFAGGLTMNTGSLPAGSYPKTDNITITVVDTGDAAILGMQNNEYDSQRYEAPVSFVQLVTNNTYNNIKLVNTPSQWDYYLMFNTAINPLNDLIVRQAMSYAINKVAVAQQARGNYATVTDSVIPQCFFPDYYNPNIQKYTYNVAKANKMLDDAGYTDVDGDNIRENPNYVPPTSTKAGGIPGFEFVVTIFGMSLMVAMYRKRYQ